MVYNYAVIYSFIKNRIRNRIQCECIPCDTFYTYGINLGTISKESEIVSKY